MNKWLFKAVGQSSIVRLGSVLVLLATSILMARTLGPEGLGAYTFVFSLISVAVLIAQLGLPQLTVREISRGLELGRRRLLARYLQFAWRFIGGASILLTFLIVVFLLIFGPSHFSSWQVMLAGLPLVVLFPLIAQAGAVLRGSGRVVQGILGEQLYRPSAFLILLVLYLATGLPVSPVTAMLLMAIASVLVLIEQFRSASRATPELGTAAKVSFKRVGTWSSSALIFSGVAIVQYVNTKFDLIALGLLADERQVGIYTVGAQLSQASAAILSSAIVVVMPAISRASASGADDVAEQLCRKTAILSLAGAGSALLGSFFIGEWVIVNIYGPEYDSAWLVLIILISGQIANAFFGPVAVLLNMRGQERTTLYATFIASVVNVGLHFALIPEYGLIGAAISTSVSMAIWNLILWTRAWSLWRINSSAMPSFPFRIKPKF